jgi:hypothetical protein
MLEYDKNTMRRAFLFFLIMAMCSIDGIQAQETENVQTTTVKQDFSTSNVMSENDMSFLKGQTKFLVEFDFSAPVIDGMSVDEFATRKDISPVDFGRFQRELSETCEELSRKFLVMSDKSLSTVRFFLSGDYRYKIIFRLEQTNATGHTNTTRVYFVDTQTQQILAILAFENSKGGIWGTYTNLLGDSYTRYIIPRFLHIFKKTYKLQNN